MDGSVIFMLCSMEFFIPRGVSGTKGGGRKAEGVGGTPS